MSSEREFVSARKVGRRTAATAAAHAPLPDRSEPLGPAALLELQRAAGNQAVRGLVEGTSSGATLQRYTGGHPLANALNMSTPAARAALGEPVFQTLIQWWRLRDLEPILRDPAPILRLQSLAANFAGVGQDELGTLIAALTPGLGVAAFVALPVGHARFLHRHVANLQMANAMLAAVNDVTWADAVMQFLQPYLGDAARLAVARQELARLNHDLHRAGPVVQFLVTYAADPVALPIARQELATANDDPVAAGAEMAVLARYNFDRALRARTEAKAQAVAGAELSGATVRAAADKTLKYQQAEAAETQHVKQHTPPPPKSGKKMNPTARSKAEKAERAFEKESAAAAQVRTAAEAQADVDEQQALATASHHAAATKQQVITDVEQFIATVTQSHGAATANYVIETADLEPAAANAVLPLFTAMAGRDADARSHAAWAMATCGTDVARLSRAVGHLQAADRAGLPRAQAQQIVDMLMRITIGTGARDRLLAIAGHYAGDWAAVSTFVLSNYATKGDDATNALEQARTHNVPLAELVQFGSSAHVFTRYVAQHPAFFTGMSAWLRTAWPAKHADLNDLCSVLVDMRTLPPAAIDVLALEHPQHLAALRANPAALAHVIGAAATTPVAALRGDLPWYAQWFGPHGQGVAGVPAIVAAFTDVAERTRLIGPFKHAALRARLVTAKGAMTPQQFAKLARVAETASNVGSSPDRLEDALAAIATTYPTHADQLYDQLHASSIGSLPTVIIDAAARGAPREYIAWVAARYGSVGAADFFLGHDNAFHEYLAGDGANLVQSRTITLYRQRPTTTAGTSNDILHVFDLEFTLHSGAVIASELHNHVNRNSKKQTSLHFKNGSEKGRELDLRSTLAAASQTVVRASAVNTIFPGGYDLS